mgnify:CR=1 FL=1
MLREVVELEMENRMGAENLSRMIGPTVFRSRVFNAADFLNHGTYYDAIQKMILHFDRIFPPARSGAGSLNRSPEDD